MTDEIFDTRNRPNGNFMIYRNSIDRFLESNSIVVT